MDHPLFDSLDSILTALTDMEIRTLTYISPINYQMGLRFVGEEFRQILSANIRVIKQFIDRRAGELQGRVHWLDFSILLSSKYILKPDDPTGHLNQAGRQFLAERISGEILRWVSQAPPDSNGHYLS
jgi:hypothetical protein